MRTTRTWTISLPPEMSRLASAVAHAEHRTKSELVREALRLYVAQAGAPRASGVEERLARVGELAAVYRQHTAIQRPTESQLRDEAKGVRRLHDRLKHLAS